MLISLYPTWARCDLHLPLSRGEMDTEPWDTSCPVPLTTHPTPWKSQSREICLSWGNSSLQQYLGKGNLQELL